MERVLTVNHIERIIFEREVFALNRKKINIRFLKVIPRQPLRDFDSLRRDVYACDVIGDVGQKDGVSTLTASKV